MKRVAAGLVALVLLASAAWSFSNESTIEDWLVDRLIVDTTEQSVQVPLQDDEHWMVIVVDFEGNEAGNVWGTEEAENLLEQAVIPYIEQLSGNSSTLDITVHPNVIRAQGTYDVYGKDGSGKDTDTDGTFLPAKLAEEAVTAVRDDMNWSSFDLDNDGKVDRLLVLHTTKGQEESPGITQRIWSHFTQFETPISLSGDMVVEHYTMASLQTGSSGVGTMIHEMLHQMGAVDLYPVHDEVGVQSWKGPGDWDIMASGNWNGGGRWPAMPTGANMELVRPERVETIELSWPSNTAQPCIGPSVLLNGVTEGGVVLKIPLNNMESIFIEHRSDSGYDSRLPGHGILVSQQDLSVGDFERNEVNTNPNLPWLKVIEADEGNDLVRGSNQGEASDLFRHNMSFGASGVQIRTHDGLLVPWTAAVTGEGYVSVSFLAEHCNPDFDLDMRDHGATVLADDVIPVHISGGSESISSDLTSSDGRSVVLASEEGGYHLEFNRAGTPNSMLIIQGTISCGLSSVDLEYPVHVMNRIPLDSTFSATIHPTEPTSLTVPIESFGTGEQRLAVTLDGPLSRVASGPDDVVVKEDGSYTLNIEPSGLLTNNMLVYGSIVLMNDDGLSWSIELELEASTQSDDLVATWTAPGRVIGAMLLILGLTALSAAVPKKEPSSSPETPIEPQSPVMEMDAWGRPVDGLESTNSLDIEK